MDYKQEAIKVLKELAKTYPNQALTNHIMLALEDYKELDWVSDKEFYFALEKYRCEKELDILPATDAEVDLLYNDSFIIEDQDIFDEDDYQ